MQARMQLILTLVQTVIADQSAALTAFWTGFRRATVQSCTVCSSDLDVILASARLRSTLLLSAEINGRKLVTL